MGKLITGRKKGGIRGVCGKNCWKLDFVKKWDRDSMSVLYLGYDFMIADEKLTTK